MKNLKKLVACLLMSFPLLSVSQTARWKLESIKDNNDKVIGYIYQTYSFGTQSEPKQEKVVSALRLICSTTGSDEPIIAVYWNDDLGASKFQHPTVRVDGTDKTSRTMWIQDHKLLFSQISWSTSLIQSMRTGNIVKFEWESADFIKRRSTSFDIKTFNYRLNEFVSACNIKL